MHRLLLLSLIFCWNFPLFGETFVLESPNDKNRLTIKVFDEITFEIQRNNDVILAHSPISVKWDNGIDMSKDQLIIKKVRRDSRKGRLRPEIGPASRISHAYKEIHIIFEAPYDLIFRIYDQGIAYRFVSRLEKKEEKGELKVLEEKAFYNLVGDPLIYYPQVKKYQNSFEENYLAIPHSKLPKKSMALTPTLIKTTQGPLMMVTEADLRDYPGMYLHPQPSGLRVSFPAKVKKQSQELLGKLGFQKAVFSGMKARSREKYLADTHTGRDFPWRVFMVGDQETEISNNTLIYSLAPENKLKNTDWIRPGKVVWDWYHDWRIPGLSFKPGINTETYLYYIDFAAENGFAYINLDEGWTHNKKLLEVDKDIDIERIVAYGKRKKVGVFIWMMYWVLEENMEEYLDQFQKWGIAGIKVDFMDRDDQDVVNFYERLAKAAAERKLLINFHGAYKPTGLAMAYPNIINREGVVGLENNKFSDRCTPTHNLTLPFTRNVIGPMDYTPGAMRHVSPENFKKSWKRPKAMSSRAHQLAMYIVYYGPLQMISDAPPLYPREALEFLSAVPTTWDESNCIEGEIGKYILMARRKGGDWYLGGMCGDEARKVKLNMDFLPKGKSYKAILLRDGESIDEVVREEIFVRGGESFEVKMEAAGGFALHMVPR